MKRFLLKTLLGVAITSLFFISIEAIQRFKHPDFLTSRNVSLTFHGLRGDKVKVRRAPGTLRLLFLGGSTTYGVFNADDATFPFLTANILKEKMPGVSVEAINAGHCGLTSSGEARTLEKMLYLRPDIAVVMTGYNDSAAVYGDCDAINRGGTLHLRPWYLVLDLFFSSHSVAYITLKEKILRLLQRSTNPTLDLLQKLNPCAGPNPAWANSQNEAKWFDQHPNNFRRNLEHMLKTSAAHKIKLVFIKAPLSTQRRSQFPLYAKAYSLLMTELHALCARTGASLLDLEDPAWDSKPAKYLSPDGLHFTRAGNFIIASKLSDFLLRHDPRLTNAPQETRI